MTDANPIKEKAPISSLKKRADFLRLNKSKTKWVSGSLIIQTAPKTADTQDLQYGITVTKKIFKSAVKRNRVKRRLRALTREIIANKANPDQNYVLIGRTATLTTPYETLKKDLKWCLKRLGCLKDAKQNQ